MNKDFSFTAREKAGGRSILFFNAWFSTSLEVTATLIERVDVDCRRKLDNLDFGGLRARVSTHAETHYVTFAIDRSAARAELPHALPACTHA